MQLSTDWDEVGQMDGNIKLELAFSVRPSSLLTVSWENLQALDLHTEDELSVSCHGGE